MQTDADRQTDKVTDELSYPIRSNFLFYSVCALYVNQRRPMLLMLDATPP